MCPDPLRPAFPQETEHGPRWIEQLDRIRWTTPALRQSRQHVILTPTVTGESGPCCISLLQFIPVSQNGHVVRVDLSAYLRSSDLYTGLPYDAAGLSAVLESVARAWDADAGWVIMTLGVPHIYERDRQAVERLLSET